MPNYNQVNTAAAKALKAVLLISAIAVGIILLIVIFKAIFIVGLFKFFAAIFSTKFGMDSSVAMFFAILSTAATLVCTPWIFMFLAFGRYKTEVLISFLLAFCVLVGLVTVFSSHTYFDRQTGESKKFYVKTLEGFKLSSTEDWDPVFQVKYKPMNGEIAKEYYFWKKTGKLPTVPAIEPGKYFDLLTGTPITWYVRRPNGSIDLSSLPGYDQASGRPLLPMTEKLGDSLNASQIMIAPKRMSRESEERLLRLFTYEIKGRLSERDSLPVWQKIIMQAYASAEEICPVTGNEIDAEDNSFWGSRRFKISLEKIIPLSSRYTVFGLLFYGINSGKNVKVNFYLISPDGERHTPIAIHVDKQMTPKEGRIENLYEGETRRVLYVFDYIPTDSLFPGKLYFEGMSSGKHDSVFDDDDLKYQLTYSKKN